MIGDCVLLKSWHIYVREFLKLQHDIEKKEESYSISVIEIFEHRNCLETETIIDNPSMQTAI